MPRLPEKSEVERYDPSHDSARHESRGRIEGFGLLQIAWKRKPLIALGAVLGLLVGWVYFLQRPPVYESTTQVQVEKRVPNVPVQVMDAGAMGMYEDYLSTQMTVIRSPRIVGEAVKSGNLNDLPSFAGKGDATATIRSALTVTREVQPGTSGPTSILNLSFRAANSEDSAVVLRTILETYDRYLTEYYKDANTKTFDELVQMNEGLQKELGVDREKLKDLHKTSKVIPTKDGGSLQLEILTNIQTRRANVAMRRAEAQVRLDAIKQAQAKGQDVTPYLDLAIDASKSVVSLTDPEGANLENLLRPLFIRERQLLVLFGPAHPDVKAVQEEIKATREVWEAKHPASLPEPGPGGRPKEKVASKEAVDIYVRSLEGQLKDFELSEKALTDLAEKETKSVSELGSSIDDEDALRKKIAGTQKLADNILDRMQAVNLVKSHNGYKTEVISPPAAGNQVEPKATPILLAALMGGLLLGVGLAWLAEVTDQSFRNPEDIRRRLRVQVLGHVPRIAPTEEEKRMAEQGLLPLDPSICAFYQPKSVDAEAFRGLRTTLFFKLEGQGHKVIQITSPNMGDGKTTLATNLAVSVAQSGKRTLLVDADFRRPRLHKMFGMDATTGLASVIAEDTDLQDAIKPCPVPNLFLLPCGPRPDNPAELLTSKRFLDLLDVLREQFDIILVDTPPLLAVSDPSVVAPRVDGVLLTIRVAKNGRPAAERAREILTNLGANVYGVVVNGIDSAANQGYGASQYGYSYNYAYGYTYDAADNNSYYHDAEADAPVNGAHEANGTSGTNGKARRGGRSRRRREQPGGLIRWLRESLWH